MLQGHSISQLPLHHLAFAYQAAWQDRLQVLWLGTSLQTTAVGGKTDSEATNLHCRHPPCEEPPQTKAVPRQSPARSSRGPAGHRVPGGTRWLQGIQGTSLVRAGGSRCCHARGRAGSERETWAGSDGRRPASAREKGAVSPASHPQPRPGALCQGSQRCAADYLKKKRLFSLWKSIPLGVPEVCGGWQQSHGCWGHRASFLRGHAAKALQPQRSLHTCWEMRRQWRQRLLIFHWFGFLHGEGTAADTAAYDCPYGRWGVSAQGARECLIWGATYKGNKNYGRLGKAGFRNPSRAGGQQGTNAAPCLLCLCFQRQRILPPGTTLKRVQDFVHFSWRTFYFTSSPGTFWF